MPIENAIRFRCDVCGVAFEVMRFVEVESLPVQVSVTIPPAPPRWFAQGRVVKCPAHNVARQRPAPPPEKLREHGPKFDDFERRTLLSRN